MHWICVTTHCVVHYWHTEAISTLLWSSQVLPLQREKKSDEGNSSRSDKPNLCVYAPNVSVNFRFVYGVFWVVHNAESQIGLFSIFDIRRTSRPKDWLSVSLMKYSLIRFKKTACCCHMKNIVMFLKRNMLLPWSYRLTLHIMSNLFEIF